MLKFYYNTGPNPMKVALFLEEAAIEYQAIPVDTRKGINTKKIIYKSIQMQKLQQ